MNLQETMRRRKVNAMIADAHFLQEQELSPELKEIKEREKRRAMFEFSVGRISAEERNTILELLNGRNGR